MFLQHSTGHGLTTSKPYRGLSMADLQNNVFKTVHLLDTKLCPTDREILATFGVADVSLETDHFKSLFLKNGQ